jgi:hypothetical protein
MNLITNTDCFSNVTSMSGYEFVVILFIIIICASLICNYVTSIIFKNNMEQNIEEKDDEDSFNKIV